MKNNSNILFKEDNEELFWSYWQKLAAKESYRYLPLNIKADLAVSKSLSLFYKERSFVCLSGEEPIAGVFLPIEKVVDKFSISIGGGYVASPLFSNCTTKKRNEIFSLVDKLAIENKVGKIMLEIDPLSRANCNYLQEYNYLGASILTYIIDLKIENLFNPLRRNHKRNIDFISKDKDFSVFYIDKENATFEIHEEYRQLHHKCSGRITRPIDIFNLQFEKLKQGNAVLFGLKYKDKKIAFVYFEFNSDKAVTFSAADDPAYDKLPLYHVLYYSGMEYLKKRGVRAIDTGQPSGPSSQLNYYLDKKQANIVLFKRGFGGYFKESFRGIKYLSQERFAEDIEVFRKNYLKNLADN